AVAAINKGSGCRVHGGIFNFYQTITHGTDRKTHQRIILVVGAYEAEEMCRIKLAIEAVHPVTVRQREILAHFLATEIIRIGHAQPRRHVKATHINTIVWCAISEDL